MNRDEQRESRTILRRIEAHLRQSHLDLGAKEESISFVDVIYHTGSSISTLNYVTPRKNTAWVSGNHVQQGLELLSEKGRRERVRFVAGLYPPVFVRALRDLDLEVEDEVPMMVYKQPEDHDEKTKLASYPNDVSFTRVSTVRDLSIWWYVWRNAYYDVAVSSVEPLLIGSNMQDVYFGRQINIVMYRNSYPMGVIRVTMHKGTAHLVSHALLKELRTPEWDKAIRAVAVDLAIENGADMVFVAGKTEEERDMYRKMGFIDAGSIVSYAEKVKKTPDKEETDGSLAQSVLVV